MHWEGEHLVRGSRERIKRFKSRGRGIDLGYVCSCLFFFAGESSRLEELNIKLPVFPHFTQCFYDIPFPRINTNANQYLFQTAILLESRPPLPKFGRGVDILFPI